MQMKRIAAFTMALLTACAYTLAWAIPIFRGHVGPCTLEVHCPPAEGPTRYYYELEGSGFLRTIHIDYGENLACSGSFRDLPPGDYVLRCTGVILENLTLTAEEPCLEVWPKDFWPVQPPR